MTSTLSPWAVSWRRRRRPTAPPGSGACGPRPRRGAGGELLDRLVAWCRADSLPGARDDVRLHVTEGNAGARELYVGRGFAPTGTWEELRPGSPLRIEELSLPLR